jgi:hypothetical protein
MLDANRVHGALGGRALAPIMGLLAGLDAQLARACPDCDVGRVARNQFWSDGFAANLAIALAPFLFIAALAVLGERLARQRQHSTHEVSDG